VVLALGSVYICVLATETQRNEYATSVFQSVIVSNFLLNLHCLEQLILKMASLNYAITYIFFQNSNPEFFCSLMLFCYEDHQQTPLLFFN